MPVFSTIIASTVFVVLILSPNSRRALIGFVLLMFALVGWFAVLSPYDLGGVAIKMAALGRGHEAQSSLTTFTGRLNVWNEALKYAKEHPLFGYGYNSFLDSRTLPVMSNAAGWVPISLHSGYVETLLGVGSVGTVLLIVTLFSALKRSISLSRRGPAYAFGAAVVTWLIFNLFMESSLMMEPMFPTFVCFVVIAQLAFPTR
jgi:exopolysaccharide production protein ExoQ